MAHATPAPSVRTLEAQVPAVAAGSDASTVVGVAPYAGTVTAVTYVPITTITGADTNTRTVALTNKGQAGAGSTAVASLALASGVNSTGADEKTITLNATAANLVLVAGDVLVWSSTHAASGLADTGGMVRVTVSRS